MELLLLLFQRWFCFPGRVRCFLVMDGVKPWQTEFIRINTDVPTCGVGVAVLICGF